MLYLCGKRNSRFTFDLSYMNADIKHFYDGAARKELYGDVTEPILLIAAEMHGNPVNILALIKSESPKAPEKINIDEIFKLR